MPPPLRQLPGNPIVNAVTIVLGIAALGVAAVFGFVLFGAFLIAAAVFVSVISLRLWWLRRKLAKSGGAGRHSAARGTARRDDGSVLIDVEYEVLDGQKRRPRR